MKVVYDLMTNAFIFDLTTCLDTPAMVACASGTCAHCSIQAPRFNSFKFTLGTILVSPVRNYPLSVGHVYQNTLRYRGLEGSSVNRTKSVPVA